MTIIQKGEPMSDLISRKAAIDALDVLCQEHRYKIPGKGETYSQYNEAWQDALDRAEGAIGNLLPAEPQIIRCKDCKHWIPYDWMFSEVWHSKNIADYPEDEIGCALSDMAMKANDFCSRAERREVTT